ncbi:Hypothetical_protein [Hexamita inflata]|uniref:Hypothetical_protein n=1 Tax=Hexamita inflata TaxID=28002 RepID=A0AA86RRK3_9EUKA|nr:Hypothetical protein HINF_LOCUS64417 [Hexamita inflata]
MSAVHLAAVEFILSFYFCVNEQLMSLSVRSRSKTKPIYYLFLDQVTANFVRIRRKSLFSKDVQVSRRQAVANSVGAACFSVYQFGAHGFRGKVEGQRPCDLHIT